MVNIKLPTNVSIMFTENSYAIYVMEAMNCEDPDCIEGAHARVITDYADASRVMHGWAERFLALSKVEGEG